MIPCPLWPSLPFLFPSLGATHVHSSPCQGNTALFCITYRPGSFLGSSFLGDCSGCLSPTSPRTEPDSAQGLTLSLTHPAFIFLCPGGSVSSVLTVWGEGRDGEFTATAGCAPASGLPGSPQSPQDTPSLLVLETEAQLCSSF